MKSEEMKMKKFEMLICDIERYFGDTGYGGWKHVNNEVEKMSPFEFLLDNDGENEYVNLIYKNTFKFQGACCAIDCTDEQSIIEFIEKIRFCNRCTNWRNQRCNVAKRLMFWLILIVSVDNKNYNENLSIVSDAAYLLGFDEKKMADWIAAVKGVLEGKKLNEVNYQTEEAKAFFIR